MNAAQIAPSLVIEFRDKKPDGSGLWLILDTALTKDQAAQKLIRHHLPDTCESRLVPNAGKVQVPAPVVVDSETTKALVEELTEENRTLRRIKIQVEADLAKLRRSIAPTPKPAETAADPEPLPFGVGAVVRDTLTDARVVVTEINPIHPRSGQPRHGFAWRNLGLKEGAKDSVGFCPAVSARYFAVMTPARDSSSSADTAAVTEILPATESPSVDAAATTPAASAPILPTTEAATTGGKVRPVAPARAPVVRKPSATRLAGSGVRKARTAKHGKAVAAKPPGSSAPKHRRK